MVHVRSTITYIFLVFKTVLNEFLKQCHSKGNGCTIDLKRPVIIYKTFLNNTNANASRVYTLF